MKVDKVVIFIDVLMFVVLQTLLNTSSQHDIVWFPSDPSLLDHLDPGPCANLRRALPLSSAHYQGASAAESSEAVWV
jgi:hypothetical protein